MKSLNLFSSDTSRKPGRSVRCARPLHWVLKVLLALYFVVCFLFLGARWFITTHIDEYRSEISTLVSEASGVDFKASKFSAGFYYIWPTFTLENVEVSRPGGPVSLTLPIVQGQLSWSSLWHLEPRFRHFSILHPNLKVRRLNEGLIDVAGFLLPVPKDFTPEGIEMAAAVPVNKFDNRLTAWLLAQGRLELLYGSVVYLDKDEDQPIRISNANIVFEQGLLDWRAAIEGTAHTDEIGRDFKLRAAIRKDIFARSEDPTSWTGQAYINFAKTDVARLIKKFGFRNIVTSGTASSEIWFDFNKGSITHSTVDLALTDIDLKLTRASTPLRIQWLGTRLQYEAEIGDTISRTLKLSNLDFLTDRNEHLGRTDILASIKTDTSDHPCEGTFEASHIDLRPLVSIAHRLPIPEKVRSFLNDHPLQGELTGMNLAFSGDPKNPSNWTASSSFKDLSLATAKDSIPGFSGLSGKIIPIQQTGGVKLILDSRNVRLSFPNVFRRETISLDQLESTLELNFNPQPTLLIHSLKVSNDDALITGAGSWLGTGGPGTLNLSGVIHRAKAEAVPKYIPKKLGYKLLNWLEAGILDGDISEGVYYVQGPLKSFPWDDHNKGKGYFKIAANLKHGKLDFLPSHEKDSNGYWKIESQYPILRGIDARLVFEGNSMDIRGHAARSEGLLASDISVRIPSYLTDSRLLIDGRIQGDLADALGYVNSSHQLRRILSDAFVHSRGSGEADMRLKLEMPFKHPSDLQLDLDLGLKKVLFNYGYGVPEAREVNGRLYITKTSVRTDEPITGLTSAGPLTVDVRTEDGKINLMTQGSVTVSDIERMIGLKAASPFFTQVSGTTPVIIHTAIGLTEPHFSINGTSELNGLTSQLPVPFKKKANEPWPISFAWISHDNGHDLTIHSFGRASMKLRFEKKDGKPIWTSGIIALGPQRNLSLGNDIDISVTTPQLSLTDWLPYARQAVEIVQSEKNADDTRPLIERIGTVSVKADVLEWHEKTYPEVEATLRRFNTRDWHLRLGGNQLLSGSATYESSTDTHGDVLTLKFGHLHLPLPPEDAPDTPENESAPFTDLPDMTVVVDDLAIGDMQIGKVVAHAQNRFESVRKLWDVQKLEIYNKGGKLSGKGVWAHDPEDKGQTTIGVILDIDDMGAVLSSLNVDNAMKSAPTHASSELSWKGTPFLPDLATLNGTVTAESGSGSFLQIEPGAGRLLSLLSLQHLLHRITLDFRDVLSQGFTFDSLFLTGNFENGTFSTPKATVFGSAATVVLGGKADLVQETIDAKAVILPAINAGGPTLALALVNPAVGIGTFLTQLILQDQLSNIFRAEYDIKGSLDAPDITKINLNEKSGERRNGAVQ